MVGLAFVSRAVPVSDMTHGGLVDAVDVVREVEPDFPFQLGGFGIAHRPVIHEEVVAFTTGRGRVDVERFNAEMGAGAARPVGQIPRLAIVGDQRIRGLCGKFEQFAAEGQVHGTALRDADGMVRAGLDEAVLRRGGRAGGQQASIIFDEPVEDERGRTAQAGKGLGEKLAVEREEVMLPDVPAVPHAAHRPVGEGGTARDGDGGPPQVHVVVANPAVAAVLDFRGGPSAGAQVGDQVQQRAVAFAEVAGLRRPVIHLRVDVGGPVAAPGRAHVRVPDALLVCRLRAGAELAIIR